MIIYVRTGNRENVCYSRVSRKQISMFDVMIYAVVVMVCDVVLFSVSSMDSDRKVVVIMIV